MRRLICQPAKHDGRRDITLMTTGSAGIGSRTGDEIQNAQNQLAQKSIDGTRLEVLKSVSL
jgi:hypothetical protein